MTLRKNLPLEEKLKTPILQLPLCKEVKYELYGKSVKHLRQLYDKYHSAPGRLCLPGFKTRVFAEAGYLLVAMGLDYGNRRNGELNILGVLDSRLKEHVKSSRMRKIDEYANELV